MTMEFTLVDICPAEYIEEHGDGETTLLFGYELDDSTTWQQILDVLAFDAVLQDFFDEKDITDEQIDAAVKLYGESIIAPLHHRIIESCENLPTFDDTDMQIWTMLRIKQ